MEYNPYYNNYYELYHFGVPGMKWGVRKEEYKKREKKLFDTNKRITENFRKNKYKHNEAGTKSRIEYAANKWSQYAYYRKDRIKMHENIAKGKNAFGEHGKAFLKNMGRQTLAGIGIGAVGVGTAALTGNPLLGMSVANLGATGYSAGLFGTRIYNMVKNR